MNKLILASIFALLMFVGVNAHAGTPTFPPDLLICCEYESELVADEFICGTFPQESGCAPPPPDFEFFQQFQGDLCNDNTGRCEGPTRNVPTLGEWGLVAMAAVLGIIGYMILRRKKAAA